MKTFFFDDSSVINNKPQRQNEQQKGLIVPIEGWNRHPAEGSCAARALAER